MNFAANKIVLQTPTVFVNVIILFSLTTPFLQAFIFM